MSIITDIQKTLAAELLTVEKTDNQELIKTRLAICEGCPMFDAKKRKCLDCGCFMDVKATLLKHRNPKKLGRIELTHCPLGKWADEDIANFYKAKDNKELLK